MGDKIKTVLKYFILIAVFCFLINPAKADFVEIEYVNGDCEIPFFAQDEDFDKFLSSDREPELTFVVDTRPLFIDNNYTESFKVITYELNQNNEKEILASADLSFPTGSRNKRRLFFQIKVPPFTGEKEIYIALHKSDGSWASTHRAIYNFRGDFTESQSAFSPHHSDLSLNSNLSSNLQSSTIECEDNSFSECNLDSLFFNRVQFEIVPRTQAKKVNIRKGADGIYKISIPIVRSSSVKKNKNHNILDDVFEDIGTGNSNGGTNNNKKNNSGLSEEEIFNLKQDILSQIRNELAVKLGSNAGEEINFENIINAVVAKIEIPEANTLETENALIEIPASKGNKAALKFNDSKLSNRSIDGAFEYSNGILYFTSRGSRQRIIMDQSRSSLPNIPSLPNIVPQSVNSHGLLSTKSKSATINYTGTSKVTFYTSEDAEDSEIELPSSGKLATTDDVNAIDSRLNALQVTMNALQNQDSESAKKLLNGETGAAMTLTGDHNIVLNTSAETNLNLPSSGTLATQEDLADYAKTETINNLATQTALNNLRTEIQNGSATLKDKSIHSNKLADNTITGSKIQDKTLTNNDIADNANIHGNKLKDKSVPGNKIQDGSINGSKIQDKTLTNNDIADNANIHGTGQPQSRLSYFGKEYLVSTDC